MLAGCNRAADTLFRPYRPELSERSGTLNRRLVDTLAGV